MMTPSRRRALGLLTAASLAALPQLATAQAYPTKPVKIIVPFAAGGRADALARMLAQGLKEQMGQPFVVENRGGASGSLGSDLVAKAPPDGYTLLLASTGTQAILPKITAKLPYDADRDFTPIALMVESYSFIGVHPGVKAANLKEFVDLARAKPGEFNYASSGVGTYNHFAGEFFNIAAGTKITHIAYRGSGPSVNDLVAGHVQMMIGGEFVEIAQAGKVRILATTNPQRWPGLPDIPTMKEAGLAEFSAPPLWFGLLGPGGMPRELIEKLNQAANKAMSDPRTVERIKAAASIVRSESTDAFASLIKAEQKAFGDVAKQTNMKFEE